jgi:hypothetical protein
MKCEVFALCSGAALGCSARPLAVQVSSCGAPGAQACQAAGLLWHSARC